MSGQSSADYHRTRAEIELQRAEQASDPKTAALHRELAELHLLSAAQGADEEQAATSTAVSDQLAKSAG